MTTQPDTTDPTTGEQPELCWLDINALVAHPDNPRAEPGDLTELERSIRAHGILEPLVVLPANDNGQHPIIAGHRRHAAALQTGNVSTVPAVVRDMTATEVVEAMLSENINRADLTISEEITAIERLMSLDTGLTPAKLCRRVGRSQSWVRARMAVTILPARWRAALDTGDLSLAAAQAAANAADLGPEHLDQICERLTRYHWGDPDRVVTSYREELTRADAYQQALAKTHREHDSVYDGDNPPPERSKPLHDLFTNDQAIKSHVNEPCHSIQVVPITWGGGYRITDICTDPRRHAPSRAGSAGASDLAADRTRRSPDDSRAKRNGRIARLTHATETFAKRSGFKSAELTHLALRTLIDTASADALKHAATMLGHADPGNATAAGLIDDVDTAADLARTAGAVAFGIAETHMYWSPTSARCTAYLSQLTTTGWTPDGWTASAANPHTSH